MPSSDHSNISSPEGGLISIVVPMYNEAQIVDRFFDAIIEVLNELKMPWEIVCVNDGSSDETQNRLLSRREAEPRIRIVSLSRNFGKDIALTAGLDFARGEAVIPIDADLQDPPRLIPEFIEKWKAGFDVVYGSRISRDGDSASKKASAALFYRLHNYISETKLPVDTGDFRLMDRKVVDAIKRLPERNRFMKGLFAWTGFKQASIEYARESRAAGQAKWSYWRLWNFALDGITSFSTLPLRVWSYVGAFLAIMSGLYGSFIIVKTLIYGVDVPGYASIMVAVLFVGGIQLISLGVIGEYIGRIYIETKQRPLYVVADVQD